MTMETTIKLDNIKYKEFLVFEEAKTCLISEHIEKWFHETNIPFMPWFEITRDSTYFFATNICFNFETKSQAALFKLRWL